VTPNNQGRDCKMSTARYLRNWSTVGKRHFTNKTANINVKNISLQYTLVNRNIKGPAHQKQQKNTKGNIIQQHIDTRTTVSVVRALSPFVIFAVFDVQVLKCCR